MLRVQIPVRGEQRYQLTVEPGAFLALPPVCVSEAGTDRSIAIELQYGCSSGRLIGTFVPLRDHVLELRVGVASDDVSGIQPLSETVSVAMLVEAIANDEVLTPDANGLVEREMSGPGRAIVPFWGSATEGAVLSSPNGAIVAPWGEAFLEREGDEKVAAVPVKFASDYPAFVAWGGGDKPVRQRVAIYRGEPIALSLPPDGRAMRAKNAPWFPVVGTMNLREGRRYAISTLLGTYRAVFVEPAEFRAQLVRCTKTCKPDRSPNAIEGDPTPG